MYCPGIFREDEREALAGVIRRWPLGALITVVDGSAETDLLPFDYAEGPDGPLLRTHLARANPQISRLGHVDEVLVLFQGPAAYVSPSWYPSKATDPRVVPTWNYIAVQARGMPRLMDEPDWIVRQIDDLTGRMEAAAGSDWSMSDAPETFVARQIGLVAGLEISVTALTGKFKLSQNRSLADRQGVEGALAKTAPDLAAVMGRQR